MVCHDQCDSILSPWLGAAIANAIVWRPLGRSVYIDDPMHEDNDLNNISYQGDYELPFLEMQHAAMSLLEGLRSTPPPTPLPTPLPTPVLTLPITDNFTSSCTSH